MQLVEQRVADIVLDHAECARIFQQYRIDFCCKGHMTVAEACAARGLEASAVVASLEGAVRERKEQLACDDPRAMGTAALCADIVRRHHHYLRRAVPYLRPLAAKIARVHGEHNPKLHELAAAFEALVALIEPHLDQEEAVLFPALSATPPDRAVIERELATMHEDHLAVGAALERIRALADDFQTPSWGCGTYRAVMTELAAIEEDTLRHVHLENHVLMPRFVKA